MLQRMQVMQRGTGSPPYLPDLDNTADQWETSEENRLLAFLGAAGLSGPFIPERTQVFLGLFDPTISFRTRCCLFSPCGPSFQSTSPSCWPPAGHLARQSATDMAKLNTFDPFCRKPSNSMGHFFSFSRFNHLC